MPTPAILYPDPQLATRDALRDLLPDYYIDATVSMTAPTSTTGVPLPKPHISVRSSAPRRATPASANADVRLAVYAADEGAAMSLAAMVEAILLAEVSTDSIRSFGALSGPIPGLDPDTGAIFAFVSV